MRDLERLHGTFSSSVSTLGEKSDQLRSKVDVIEGRMAEMHHRMESVKRGLESLEDRCDLDTRRARRYHSTVEARLARGTENR